MEDKFYLGRDTLYLLWDAQDSLSFRDSRGRYVWRLYDPLKRIIGDPSSLLDFIREYRSFYERCWRFRQGYGISLTANELVLLCPVSRKELAYFFRREYIREARKNDLYAALMEWGDWDLLDYFPKVYMLVPKGGDFYDKYECEF